MRKMLLALTLGSLLSSTALADLIAEPLADDAFAGYYTVDMQTGETAHAGVSRSFGDIYENTIAPAAANFATSSTDLTRVYGDRVTATGTGTIKEFSLTVFNSSTSNTNPINSMTVVVNFKRDSDLSVIGGFSGTINFSSPLNPGFFSIVTWTNLDTLSTPIVTDTTGLRIEQQRTAHTGGSVRMGVASLVPINVGSSPDTMLINGAETSFTNPANPGYRVNVIPEPASLMLIGLGALAMFRRR